MTEMFMKTKYFPFQNPKTEKHQTMYMCVSKCCIRMYMCVSKTRLYHVNGFESTAP